MSTYVLNEGALVLEGVTLAEVVELVVEVLVDLAAGTVLDQKTAEDTETAHPQNLAVIHHISDCSKAPKVFQVEFVVVFFRRIRGRRLPGHTSVLGTLPLTVATVATDAASGGQLPGAGTGVHGDGLLDDEAIGNQLADGLAGVGVGDLADLVGVKPDLALAATDDGRRKALLGTEVDPVMATCQRLLLSELVVRPLRRRWRSEAEKSATNARAEGNSRRNECNLLRGHIVFEISGGPYIFDDCRRLVDVLIVSRVAVVQRRFENSAKIGLCVGESRAQAVCAQAGVGRLLASTTPSLSHYVHGRLRGAFVSDSVQTSFCSSFLEVCSCGKGHVNYPSTRLKYLQGPCSCLPAPNHQKKK